MDVSASIELLERYNRQVPRYTSYPTAPHFQHLISSSDLSDLLAKRTANEVFSLYFHIPFCHKLCTYCGCFTKIVNSASPVKAYLETLKQEIRLAGKALSRKPVVSHIHFGGGSPNIMSGEDLQALLAVVRQYFSVSEDAELAMEMDPRLLTAEKIKAFAAAGVNRASLGVQDFQEKTQEAVNRVQPYDKIRACVDGLRDAGITAVNFDLIYGLPYQTMETVADNIEKAFSLLPDRVALFGYAHVPWMKKHQALLEAHPLPDSYERWEQERVARRTLTEFGYKEIGIDHFVRPEDPMCRAYQEHTLRRNFQGYTTDNAMVLLGFGLSAISRFPESYIQNTSDIQAYRQALSKGQFPVKRGFVLSCDDKARAALIESLMCYFEVNLQEIANEYGLSPDYFKAALSRLTPLERDRLVSVAGDKIAVTEKGRPFVRVICSCFDAYFEEVKNRHVQAV